MIYASGSVALATLEMLVHLNSDDDLAGYRLFRVELPARAVEIPTSKKLPPGWDDEPIPEIAREFGTRWFLGQRSLALRVPSAVVPHDFNYLLNPTHPDFSQIKIGRAEKFLLDPRLWPMQG